MPGEEFLARLHPFSKCVWEEKRQAPESFSIEEKPLSLLNDVGLKFFGLKAQRLLL